MNSVEEQWDLEIKPKARFLDINFKEVWRYRDLLWLFIKRDFIAQYKQTILGPLWHLIQPILTTLMFLVIFGRVARIPTDGIHPIVFYLSGLTLWNYFAVCISNTSNTFVSNAAIFGKVYFPRIIMPLSIVLSNLIRFGVQLLLLTSAIVWFHFHGYEFELTSRLWVIPFLLALIAGLGFGLGIIVSSLTTKYRDLAVLLGFVVQLGLYATPVAYPMSFLRGSKYASLLELNPVAPIIESFRYALFGKGSFDASDLIYATAFTIGSFLLGLIMFSRVEKTFMDTV